MSTQISNVWVTQSISYNGKWRSIIAIYFGLEWKFSVKLLIYRRKSSDPRMETWETLALMLAHEECWSFKTTLCSLLLRNSAERVNNVSVKPYWHNLEIRPLCQILSKALEMSKNIALLSVSLSKDWKVFWVRYWQKLIYAWVSCAKTSLIEWQKIITCIFVHWIIYKTFIYCVYYIL